MTDLEVTEIIKVGLRNAITASGQSVMDINALALGLIHGSMETLIGVEAAAELDREARQNIGWPVGSDRSPKLDPAQNEAQK